MKKETNRSRRRNRRIREQKVRMIVCLFGVLLFFCIIVGVILFVNETKPEKGNAVSRDGLENLLQTAESIDYYAYPSVLTDRLEESAEAARELLEKDTVSNEELNQAYGNLLTNIQILTKK